MDIKSNDDEIRLLSLSEASKRMKIGRDTLVGLIEDGKLGVLIVGKRQKIAVREIIRYIDENTVRIAKPIMVNNNPKYKEIKSTDEIFYDVYEEVLGKVHPTRLKKIRAAEAATNLKKKSSRR